MSNGLVSYAVKYPVVDCCVLLTPRKRQKPGESLC